MMCLSNAAEVVYNTAENEGWIWGKKGSKWERPWWFGSWMVMPFAFGQLLHAFVFDRDCFPKVDFLELLFKVLMLILQEFGEVILKYSPQYIQQRPVDYPPNLPWPEKYDIVDSLAEMARLNYP